MSSGRGTGQLIYPDVSTQSCQRHGDPTPRMIKLGEIKYPTGCIELTECARCFALSPRSSVREGGTSAPLNSTFQTSLCIVSKSLLRVWCWAGSNSHKLKTRC